ncbi:MAG: HNH endonuclease family protein [Alphaproteobacteria bacterium]
MKMERADYTVEQLLALHDNHMIKANPEYQRGIVWSVAQKKKLIDSLMRGYPLPLIYLHHIKRTVADAQRDDYEIIDGQQRINSLYEFREGAHKLFDPLKDDQEGKFPNFLKAQPCPWAGMDFHSLTDELRTRFLGTTLAIAKIYTDNPNEVRDLFVRLQAGLALNSQETRDAWPGDFTDFILWLGGKPQVPRYQGHEFFKRVMRMKPESDRGKTRTVAAQIASLFLSRREHGPDHFIDISSGALDDFYYMHIDFNRSSSDAKRLVSILDKLQTLLSTGARPKLRNHDAIHLVLLVDTLWDDYTRSWESALPAALDKFSAALASAKETRYESQPEEFWLRYGQWTRVNSDKAETIRRRHVFYAEKMLGFLQPLQLKDPKRTFGSLEREIIYFRDSKLCARCKAAVLWEEAEIHHIKEHQKGGQTILANGALVHRHCHPKGAAAKAFAENYKQ